jgi:hypothetical protein
MEMKLRWIHFLLEASGDLGMGMGRREEERRREPQNMG